MNKIKRRLLLKYRKIKIVNKLGSCGINILLGSNNVFRGERNIYIGDNFDIKNNCKLQTWEKFEGYDTGYKPRLTIGNDVSVMDNCQISCLSKITIGDFVLLGDNVFITDNFHGNSEIKTLDIPPKLRQLYFKGPVVIEDNVWIGRNVCIMPNVKIGYGSVIGANSVITKDVPPYTISAGTPAKIIKKLN